MSVFRDCNPFDRRSKAPRNSPLFKKLEELYGEWPEFPLKEEKPQSIAICTPLLKLLNGHLGYTTGPLLAMLIGQWASGEIACEAFSHDFDGKPLKTNLKGIKKLVRLGYITYSQQTDLATIVEEKILQLLRKERPS